MSNIIFNKLKTLNTPIRVGIIGAGAMGKGLFHQCQLTPGIECLALADSKVEKAISFLQNNGINYRIANDIESLNQTLRQGLIAVCEDGDLVAKSELIDVLIESSSSISEAAGFAITALESGKHLVLMNSEIDLIFGPYLMNLAYTNGVVYTSCDGDQHGVIKHLIDDMQLWGIDLVMAGNIKGFLDRYSNPKKIIPEADKRNLDYKMATAYTDGTKLNIEMSLLANALGLSTDIPGMHGPRARNVREVFHLYDFDVLWEERKPFVDYILGAEPDGGVFTVGYCANDYQRSMLKYYKMGNGPYYLFYRPYHLCHIEAMSSVAEAFLFGHSLLEPSYGFRTNVFAYAKQDLGMGHKLDGIGGYMCYGMIDNCTSASIPEGLPIALANDVILKRDIKRDERILLRDVEYNSDRFDFNLYFNSLKLQEK